jgi:hypothetical protein
MNDLGAQRVSDPGIRQVVGAMLDTSRARETYACGALHDFGYAVADRLRVERGGPWLLRSGRSGAPASLSSSWRACEE